jgi:predicted regulator of Ras-like GTPase activity (Roadblock/LC7/MglB family)
VPEFVSTDIVNIDSGLSIGGGTLDADFDASIASASYSEVVKSNRRALDLLGLGNDCTEDILISTEKVYILIRMLAGEYYHLVAIARKGNLGLARAIMKKYEAPLLQAVGQLA